MLAAILAFLGSIVNMIVDTVFKVAVSLVVIFLCVIALACGFAVLLIQLLT